MRARNQGFTLIEMAIALAIISVLAAVLTRAVTNYVDQARIARATADVRTIADGMRLYQRDAARFTIYANPTAAAIGTAAAKELVGRGTAPTPPGTWSAFASPSDLVL